MENNLRNCSFPVGTDQDQTLMAVANISHSDGYYRC